MAPYPDKVGPLGTQSSKSYLKNYSKIGLNMPAEAPKEMLVERIELRFEKGSKKDYEATITPFQFDMLAQVGNIPARITLHKLLWLSKTTRDALREALANSDAFSTHITKPSINVKDSYPHCHQVTRQIPYIMLLLEDMQVKNINILDFCTIRDMKVQLR